MKSRTSAKPKRRKPAQGNAWLGDAELDDLGQWRKEAWKIWGRITPKQRDRILRDTNGESFVMGYQTARHNSSNACVSDGGPTTRKYEKQNQIPQTCSMLRNMDARRTPIERGRV